MRLISQNRKIDVPYDKVILGICDQNNRQEYVIYAYHDSPRPLFIATYSNTDKALKVMEMLRASYVNNECYKSLCSGIVIPLPDNSDDMKEKMVATRAFRETTIFQFPKDEEVEV
jgi:hypothetical protein